jgi:surface antigen
LVAIFCDKADCLLREDVALFFAAIALSLSATANEATPDHVECVPIARQQSGIQIYGDAWTWWNKAEGKYARGNAPRKGAVLAFKPHGAMTLGHVAAVSKVIDDRNILVTHANWSVIDGRRGQIERNVRIVDVSETGDWSQVRVWYAPLEDLGTTHWPAHGFIYPGDMRPEPTRYAAAKPPRLEYVSVLTAEPPKPTGRLTYLKALLPQLR